MKFFSSAVLFSVLILMNACNNTSEPVSEDRSDSLEKNEAVRANIKEEAVTVSVNGIELKNFVAYDENRKGPRPVVLVLPEWWGVTEYPRMRAKQLAELGYLAMAVDMYGDGKIAANPKEAESSAMPFYMNPAMAVSRINASLAKAKSMEGADTSRTAAIGYCFGGTMVLNAASLGSELDGVVSFHGGLEGLAKPSKEKLRTKILVCHGGADSFVPEAQVAAFKRSMDSVGADYVFTVYPGATHAFTNPDATKKGQEFKMPISYNGSADTASWNDMKAFLTRVFQ